MKKQDRFCSEKMNLKNQGVFAAPWFYVFYNPYFGKRANSFTLLKE